MRLIDLADPFDAPAVDYAMNLLGATSLGRSTLRRWTHLDVVREIVADPCLGCLGPEANV